MRKDECIAPQVALVPDLTVNLMEQHWRQEILQRWIESPKTPVECLAELQEMLAQINRRSPVSARSCRPVGPGDR